MSSSNLIFREDGTILIKNVVISYPHLFEPYGQGDGAKKYSAKFLLAKSTHKADIVALNEFLAKTAMAKWKTKLPATNLALKNGELSGKEQEEAFFILSASESRRPSVIDADKSPIYPEDADEKMYPGTIVNVLIRFWEQDNQYGRKINANLLAVQRVKDGERLAAGRANVDVDAVFDDVSSAFDDAGDDDGFGG